MSELQIALLAIGLGVIVAVYIFGWWQQKRYNSKFGATFKANHADALYQQGSADIVEQEGQSLQAEAVEESSDPVLSDDPCALVDTSSDFIIELQLVEPGPAAVLVGLWQRKFDFRKPVMVCGQTLHEGEWERVISESHTLYQRFRIALQMVDRGGVISAAKLADFRDLVTGIAKNINAQVTVPDTNDAYQQALSLDKFCASVDQMVGVNLVPPEDRLIRAIDISRAAGLHGMNLESDGAFHLLGTQGHTLFSLINQDTVPFQHHTLETFSTRGITFLLDVPRVEDPALHFDQMMKVVRDLAEGLKLNIVDDRRVVLADSGLESTRAKVFSVETSMQDNGIIPGSAQARRIFS